MILSRRGNKRAIAKEIIKYFPPHDLYIELFFGAGGIFFSKPKAKFNILNDLDDNVYKLWTILMDDEKRERLLEWLELTPNDERIYRLLRGKKVFRDDIEQVGYFLIDSNCTVYGGGGTIRMRKGNEREILISRIKSFAKELFTNTRWMNCDFREALKKISFRYEREKAGAFVYADPPYIGTAGYDGVPDWTENDFLDLVDELKNFGSKFAISERDSEFVLEVAKQNNLEVVPICNKRVIMNRHNEILLLNYKPVICNTIIEGMV